MNRQICMHFLQGRCRFGGKCFYSHDFGGQGYCQALMIRHALSTFNQIADKYPGHLFEDQIAQNELHFNKEFLDCPLSKEGEKMASETFLPSDYIQKNKQLDILFVSPLNRALETAALIIKANKLEIKKIIVLPQLTEVLSKICDFSGPLQDKIKTYATFDFNQMKRFTSQQAQGETDTHWQDSLVDSQHKKKIKANSANGDRYFRILQEIFPTPLQNSERCFQRSTRALEVMRGIIEKQKAKKIVIISHNRLLKYLDGRYNKGRAKSFLNCEIRNLIF